MYEQAISARFRVVAFVAAAAIMLGIAASVVPSPASAASVSIVNGSTTKIVKWPWQVALTQAQDRGPEASPRKRFFCGGSLIAPTMVITAGHCVADLKPREVKRVEIITGRTRLNNAAQGQVTRVRKALFPLRANGKRRYDGSRGGAVWDVALLQLAQPVAGPTIKIAGEDEAGSWAPGQLVSTTGWGVTNSQNYDVSSVLRVARQVMLPDGVCRRENGRGYDPSLMNCLGGPSGFSSSCFGDSGGPLVSTVGDEYRLVGLTSFGDAFCSGWLPSVDTRVADDPMRDWVRSTALAITGIDVVGSGGTVTPPPDWCRIPALRGLSLNRARIELLDAGCRLGKIRKTFGTRGRVFGASFIRGWLAPLGSRVELWVGR